jgi:hypothetical protein
MDYPEVSDNKIPNVELVEKDKKGRREVER